MNFVKRAGLSLWARKGRTLITLSAFLVISVMVLAGVLISDATAQAEQDAKRSVGAEVNLTMDIDQLVGGGGMQAPRVDAATVDRLGALPQVQKYTYSMWDRAILKGKYTLVGGGPIDPMGPGGTVGTGVLDTSLLPDFRSGKFTLLSGEHLTAADKDTKQLLIEERLAKQNGLKVGDKITLTGNDEKTTADFTVAGIYRDPRPTTEPDPQYEINPANMLYGAVGGLSALSSDGNGPLQVGKATFLLKDADVQAAFKDEAKRVTGSALDGFKLDANDKAIQQMTGPLKSIRSTATLAMWLMATAGAAVLALLANLAVKQRRTEYGVLLAMGEKKSNLIAQQALETVLVAALAIGLSSVFAPSLTQSAGQALLGQEATAAQKKLDSWQAPPPGSTGLGAGTDWDDKPVENADPIGKIAVALDPADLATVGGIGLGIALLATAVPAGAVLRLSPRTILTKGK
ncbi:putative ABC transport system permease protein [Streptomyces sp. SAI-135]|uniref:ABC transporter permease n=1 Tax=unclassified Streptomyces TaxID=2593676 RepID=UPI00247603B9|nr:MULTISPECIES: ABC transporter permease [unclassified Streptomyces]MDH6513782.1 putative ABC transport system permease protein [Streptomyces sp. SAI-090]MDH6622138.1 putative ABC transport system permease protein [Streptomyces sp. SAI-135]